MLVLRCRQLRSIMCSPQIMLPAESREGTAPMPGQAMQVAAAGQHQQRQKHQQYINIRFIHGDMAWRCL
jgi:hypothetical protein